RVARFFFVLPTGSAASAAQGPPVDGGERGLLLGGRLLDPERQRRAAPYGPLGAPAQMHRNRGVRQRRIAVGAQPDQLGDQVRAEAVALAERPVHRQLLTARDRLLQVLVAGGGQRQHTGGLPAAAAVQDVRGEVVRE